eukprot:NODE_843_length_3569_cov_0.535447.p4 type:complete len:145 gc:universal NODE_843_length_3569_cov_0.535447:2163-1729(-)
MSLSNTTTLLSGTCQTSRFSVLHLVAADPLVMWVSSDSSVLWVYKNDFKKFVSCILSSPVRIQNSHVSTSLTDSTLSNTLVRLLVFQLSNSLATWLTVNNTFVNRLLSTSTTNTDSVCYNSLLCFISHSVCFVNTRRFAFVYNW